MKQIITVVLLSLGVLLFKPNILSAQNSDTLDIAISDAQNISSIINSDTTTGGVISNPNRVYRLQRGIIYTLDATIKVRGSFKMIATEGTARPPVLAPAILPDNSSIQYYLEIYGNEPKVELHDLYFLGIRQDGEISNALSRCISIYGEMTSFKARDCVFDGFGSRAIQVAAAGRWSKIDVQDCNFRNLQYPGGSWLNGQAFKTISNTTPLDSVRFVNNSFVACGSYIWGVSGYVNYGLFEHNTILYGIGNTFLNAYNTKTHIKNNIVYSAFTAMGYKPAIYGDWFFPRPDTVSSSIIVINIPEQAPFRDTTLTMKGLSYLIDTTQTVTANIVGSDHDRILEVTNNAYYYPSALTNFIDAYNDTVQYQVTMTFPGGSEKMVNKIAQPRFYNDYTLDALANKIPTISPLIDVDLNETYNADPQFNGSDVVSHVDQLIGKLHEILKDKIAPERWTYELNYPPKWPLPEDLTYNNSAFMTAAEGGFPLGDLNWYPSKKAEWKESAVGTEKIDNNIPNTISLSDAYPNPFNPTTNIQFALTNTANVKLTVFNALGQVVNVLVNSSLAPGTHLVSWNGRTSSGSQVASGVYFYRLETGSFVQTKKMMMLK